MKRIAVVTLVFAGALALAVSCGGSDRRSGGGGGGNPPSGGEGEGEGSPARTGVTECGGVQCQAGQYCDNLICENGCLSNDNCAGDQTCQKEAGENEGTCQNVVAEGEGEPEGVSLADFCTKVKACNPATTDALCEQMYNGVNEACRQCIVNANCSDENACQAECGGGPSEGEGEAPQCPDHLLSSCTALCQGDLTCVKKPDAGMGDDGICTIQCGTVFDCEQVEGCAGTDTWECDDDIDGANKACVPFAW